jgi:O-antigen/teichoic acid export membrane protein
VMLVLGAASDVSIQVLYAYFRQKMTNALDILNALLIPGLQALLVGLFKLGVFGALIALLIGTAVSVVLSVRLMFRAVGDERLGLRWVTRRAPKAGPAPNGRTPRRPSTRSVWQRFTAYSAMMYVMTLSSALYDQSLVVLALGLLITDNVRLATEVALIGLAFKFVRQLLQALVVPLTGVQTPLFARLYAEDRLEGLQTAYASLTRFLILVLLPAGAGLIIMSRNLLVLLYLQPNKANVLPPELLSTAVAACAILTIGLFGESMISIALNVLMVYEDYQAVLIARAFALLSIPLLIVLEPPLGVVGVATAVSIAALGSRFVALIFGLRRLGLQFPLAFLGRVALATVPILVVIGPLALLLPAAPPQILSLEWFGLAFADGVLVLAAVFLFWLVFRRLGGLLAEDKQRFAGMRLPGIKLLLRYM